jgi:hypothetical protein
VEYRGRVAGNVIEGTMGGEGGGLRPWKAERPGKPAGP